MTATHSSDELIEDARRGQEMFDLHARPKLRPEDNGKFVAIDIDNGDYEIDSNDYEATERLMKRSPGARIWLFRAGQRTAYRIRASNCPDYVGHVAPATDALPQAKQLSKRSAVKLDSIIVLPCLPVGTP